MAEPHLDAGGWGIWRDFVLRSTGFPVDWLAPLDGSPGPEALAEVARLPLFREALAWQNRAFLHSGMAWLDRHPGRRNWRARANERTLLLYLQRYATRNESVGFFGPLAWGRLEADGAPLALAVGPRLVDGRRLSWESWALDAFQRRWKLALAGGPAATAAERMDRALEHAPDEARQAWRALEHAREALARAAGDATAVERAMADLESEFARRAGAPATRDAGRQQAARTPVREDCRRAASVAVGPDVWRRAGRSLDWLLQAQRWVTDGAGRVWRRRLEAVFDSLAIGGRVELAAFFPRARAVLEGFGAPRDPEVIARAAEARRRVRELLALPDGVRRVERRADELSSAAKALFGDARPGWPSARYHCPDLHLAAPSVERACAGELTLVLGELHSAKNTVDLSLYASVHPDPPRLGAALAADLGEGRVRLAALPEWTNGAEVPLHPGDVLLDWCDAHPDAPGAQVVTLAELELRRAGGGVRVVSRDGRREWDLLAFFDVLLGGFGAMLPFADYLPRVTVDGVVLQRETVRLDAPALTFAHEPTQAARRQSLARLAGEHGLPRRVFVRSPSEPKPIYIDLESEPFVELLAHLARASPWLRVTEMLPAPDDCWLVDADGRRYTSELRLVFVDPLTPM